MPMFSKCQKYTFDLATRSFRNIADQDYIAARACYRLGLTIQFLFLSQQAIEKYFKAILLYNLKSSKGLSHSISAAKKRVEEIDNLKFELPEESLQFLDYIDCQGVNRYLEKVHYTILDWLPLLDITIWHIRLYCHVMNYDHPITNENVLDSELASICDWRKSDRPYMYRLHGGFLEKVLSEKKNPQRGQLVWKNHYYGDRSKGRFSMRNIMNLVNPTHVLHPECYEYFDSLVHFPREIKREMKSLNESQES
jgi:HEPN domain-containing protein